MSKQNIKLEDYVLQFGKYKSMRAVDVAELYIVDKNGNDQPVGLKYLEWLSGQSWFRDTDIVKQIIDNAKNCMSDQKEESPKKKKDPKPAPKKVKKNKFVLESSDEETE